MCSKFAWANAIVQIRTQLNWILFHNEYTPIMRFKQNYATKRKFFSENAENNNWNSWTNKRIVFKYHSTYYSGTLISVSWHTESSIVQFIYNCEFPSTFFSKNRPSILGANKNSGRYFEKIELHNQQWHLVIFTGICTN